MYRLLNLNFRRLVMHCTDNFHQFLTHFLHVAGKSRLPASEYKYKFDEKLSIDFQKLVITEFHFNSLLVNSPSTAHILPTVWVKISDTQSHIRKLTTQNVFKVANFPTSCTDIPGPTKYQNEEHCYRCEEMSHITQFCARISAAKKSKDMNSIHTAGKRVTLEQDF